MIERNFSELTPENLNAEFKQLYEQLPVLINPSVLMDLDSGSDSENDMVADQIRDRLTKRGRSQHTGIIMDRLEKVLEYAKVSPYLKERITRRFSGASQLGVPKDVRVGVFKEVFGDDEKDKSGIFGDKAQAVEYRCFVDELERDLESDLYENVDYPLSEDLQEWLTSFNKHWRGF